jgi:hypothetical protein
MEPAHLSRQALRRRVGRGRWECQIIGDFFKTIYIYSGRENQGYKKGEGESELNLFKILNKKQAGNAYLPACFFIMTDRLRQKTL